MIYIGTAGFSYFDWEGIFYTEKTNKLKYYSQFFNVIEINSTFYVIPDLKVSKNLINQIKQNDDFKFILKANKVFTHNRKYSKSELLKFKTFCSSFENRLYSILFQFPYSFKNIDKSIDFLKKLIEDFNDYKKAFEFRNRSFIKEDFLNYLKKNNITLVNIDQPQIAYSIPLTNIITNTDFGYFRFHGKNYKNWFNPDIKPFERYDYLYSYKNIKFLYYKIKEIETKTNDIIIIMNNHYKAKAVLNAIEFKLLFEDKNIDIDFTNLNIKLIDELKKHIEKTG